MLVSVFFWNQVEKLRHWIFFKGITLLKCCAMTASGASTTTKMSSRSLRFGMYGIKRRRTCIFTGWYRRELFCLFSVYTKKNIVYWPSCLLNVQTATAVDMFADVETPVIFSVNVTCNVPSLKNNNHVVITLFVNIKLYSYLPRWKLAATLGASGKLLRVNFENELNSF